MPSGVCQGSICQGSISEAAASADAADAVSANSTCEKFGMRLMRCLPAVIRSRSNQTIVSGAESRKEVGTLINKGVHSCAAQERLLGARTPRKINMLCAGRFERRNGGGSLFFIDFIGRAKAGQGRAGSFEDGCEIRPGAGDRFDPADLEEILGESDS